MLTELELENRESAAVDQSLKADISQVLSDQEECHETRRRDPKPAEDDFETIKLISNGAYA